MDQETREKIENAISGRLKDEIEGVRFVAIKAMSLLKGTVDASVEELIRCLVFGDNRQSNQAKDALINVGEPAVDGLIEILEKGVRNPDYDPEDEDGGEEEWIQDQNARLNALGILTEIYKQADHKDKQGEESDCCGHKKDGPQELVDVIKEGLSSVLSDIFTRLTNGNKDSEETTGDVEKADVDEEFDRLKEEAKGAL